MQHIIIEREKEKQGHSEIILRDLAETISKAEFSKKNNKGNFEFVYQKDGIKRFVIFAPEYHGNKLTFVLTAFNRYKKK